MTTRSITSSTTPSACSEFIRKRINELRGIKSQREIAAEAGYPKPNILSMIKHGETKLPLERVPAIAKALDCDVALLFSLALQQYFDEDAIAAFRRALLADYTENEQHWIGVIRKAGHGRDPECTPFIQRFLFTMLKLD